MARTYAEEPAQPVRDQFQSPLRLLRRREKKEMIIFASPSSGELTVALSMTLSPMVDL